MWWLQCCFWQSQRSSGLWSCCHLPWELCLDHWNYFCGSSVFWMFGAISIPIFALTPGWNPMVPCPPASTLLASRLPPFTLDGSVLIVIEDVHDRRFHETIHDELFRHFRNTGGQGYRSQFLLDVDHWFLFGKGSHVSHFPEGRKTLFNGGGIQDFRDGIGHQVVYSFSSQLGVLSGPQAFLGLRTSSALCTCCSVTLKISGESDSRGTRSRGAGSLHSPSGFRRAALMALACSLKGSWFCMSLVMICL